MGLDRAGHCRRRPLDPHPVRLRRDIPSHARDSCYVGGKVRQMLAARSAPSLDFFAADRAPPFPTSTPLPDLRALSAVPLREASANCNSKSAWLIGMQPSASERTKLQNSGQ